MQPDFTRPYLIVIGTSHTDGACKEPDGTKSLAPNEKWATKLGVHLGYTVYNLSRPGVINERITQILNDIFDEWDLTKCKGILIEGRLNDAGSAFIYSAFNDYEHFAIPSKLRRDIYSTTDYGKQDWAFNEFFSVYAGGKVVKPNYIKGLLKKPFGLFDSIPDQAVEDLDNYLEHRANFYHRTDHQFWDDVCEIRNWQQMCKLAGVPFKWFSWTKIRDAEGMLVDYMIKEYSNVFDDNLLQQSENRVKGLWEYFLEMGYKNNDPEIHCECKHLNALGNQIAYDILEPKIDNWLMESNG